MFHRTVDSIRRGFWLGALQSRERRELHGQRGFAPGGLSSGAVTIYLR